MNIKQLKAKVKEAQKANAAKIAEAAEVACLEATLKLESSKSLFNSKVKLAAISHNTNMLQGLLKECETLVDTVPVVNTKTRTLRKWSGSFRFKFGAQVNMMYQLATGILYSCADHRELLLTHTGLNTELLEQITEAFGTPSYYSRNNHVIVASTTYDVDKAVDALVVMQSLLGVIVDTSQVTASNFSLEFGAAEISANKNKLQADEALEEAGLQLEL